MKKFFLVDARGEFDSATACTFLLSAADLKREGAAVEVLLVQNAVMAARSGAASGALTSLLEAGVPVYAEDFALRERALAAGKLREGVKPASLGIVIDRMAGGWSVLWH